MQDAISGGRGKPSSYDGVNKQKALVGYLSQTALSGGPRRRTVASVDSLRSRCNFSSELTVEPSRSFIGNCVRGNIHKQDIELYQVTERRSQKRIVCTKRW